MADEKKNIRIKVDQTISAAFVRIGKFTKIQRLLICLVTFALMGGGYYYFFLAPKQETLNAASAELKTREATLQKFKIKARSLAKYEKEMAEAQENFNIAMKALPDKKELPSLLTGVSTAGQRAGLTFSLFQPDPVVNKEFYKEIPLAMVVSGRYQQMADFFYRVARMNRIVNIQNVEISTDPKTPGFITMKCAAVTYMFSDEPPDKDKNGKKGKKKRKK
ncbi:MAG TPA: hypothetical protein DHV36_10135 [Desulfobacteraceae bacterium]|nr:hypothetical protein [Desulfobacteraceae bacterium]